MSEKNALDWIRLTLASHEDYHTFRNLFINRFWGSSQKLRIHTELATGKFDYRAGLSMTEYFLKLANKSRLINPQMSEVEIIDSLVRHYPAHIRNHLVVAKPLDFAETIDLLSELEVNLRTEVVGGSPGKSNVNGGRESNPDAKKPLDGSPNMGNSSQKLGENHPREGGQRNYFRSDHRLPARPFSRYNNYNVRQRYANPMPREFRDNQFQYRGYVRDRDGPNNRDNRGRGLTSQVNHLEFVRGYSYNPYSRNRYSQQHRGGEMNSVPSQPTLNNPQDQNMVRTNSVNQNVCSGCSSNMNNVPQNPSPTVSASSTAEN